MKSRSFEHELIELSPQQKIFLGEKGALCADRLCLKHATHKTRYLILHYFGSSTPVSNLVCEDHAKKFGERHRLNTEVTA